jgi:5'-nucleotidase
MNNSDIQILLTNDDGIQSPGLWAAAEALSCLGYVTVAAPRDQWSGAGRSHPNHTDGSVTLQTLNVHGVEWTVYAVNGTPAQNVAHGVLEICPRKPDLVVSGINYGENVGSGTTISGTVGAALEGAGFGIPAMAVSLQTPESYNLSYSRDIDFSASKYFVTLFADMLLHHQMPPDVAVLKIEIPDNAVPTTPWRVTRVGMNSYYHASLPKRKNWEEPNRMQYTIQYSKEELDPESDVYALREERVVSVTPLTLDLTSRVSLSELDAYLHRSTGEDQAGCEPQQ